MFAEQYPKSEEGWILFPQNDANYRKSIFGEDSIRHPAKANCFLINELVRHYTSERDIILDPMAGTGTIMLGALQKRYIITIDIEDEFIKTIKASRNSIFSQYPYTGEYVLHILQGDCRKLLPIPGVNHIIFSPPYSYIVGIKAPALDGRTGLRRATVAKTYGDGALAYTEHPRNIGKLNKFLYFQEMEKVYKLCAQSLTVGYMILIVKDHIDKKERLYESHNQIRIARGAGFSVVEWHKWKPAGMPFLNIRRTRGEKIVEEEDIIVFQKEIQRWENIEFAKQPQKALVGSSMK